MAGSQYAPGEPTPTSLPMSNKAKKLGAPAIGPWAKEAKQAWQSTRPYLVGHLNNLGQLDQSAVQAENNAKAELRNRVVAGQNPVAAFHGARAQYLFLHNLPKGPAAPAAFHALQNSGPASKLNKRQQPGPLLS